MNHRNRDRLPELEERRNAREYADRVNGQSQACCDIERKREPIEKGILAAPKFQAPAETARAEREPASGEALVSNQQQAHAEEEK